VLWDTKDGRIVSHFSDHIEGPSAIGLSPSGRQLAAAGDDNVVRILQLPAGRFVQALPPCEFTINRLVWFGEHTLIVATGDRALVWNLSQNRLLYRWEAHENTIADIAVSPTAPQVATLSHDHTVRLWSLEDGREQTVLTDHVQRPVSGAFSWDGRTLATAGEQGIVRLWDITTGQELLVLRDCQVDLLHAVGFRDDHTLVAVGRFQDQVRVGTWTAQNTSAN
jgi:WD40 repeat protein